LVEVILPRSTQELAMNIQNDTPATALRRRMATGMISAVESPLDDLGARRRTRRKTGGGTP
jgi:hypothetical protein